MAKKEQTCWMWQNPKGELDVTSGRSDKAWCKAAAQSFGNRPYRMGKPVRVRITPIAAKKKGTVKR
mgnify:CR=1 FL=1